MSSVSESAVPRSVCRVCATTCENEALEARLPAGEKVTPA